MNPMRLSASFLDMLPLLRYFDNTAREVRMRGHRSINAPRKRRVKVGQIPGKFKERASKSR